MCMTKGRAKNSQDASEEEQEKEICPIRQETVTEIIEIKTVWLTVWARTDILIDRTE